MYLIQKSIFVLKNYGLGVFIKKAIRFPINRLNLLKQKITEEKGRKIQKNLVIFLNHFYLDYVFINQKVLMI